MKTLITFLLSSAALFVLMAQSTLAEQVRFESDGFEMVVSSDAKIVSQHDDGWEKKLVVEQGGHRVRVSWRQDQALILFPTGTVKITAADTSIGRTITTFVDGVKYEVVRAPREIHWKLPGQEVYFRTRGGQVNQVIAQGDFLKLHLDTPARRLTLESNAGRTDALLNDKGALETFDGPEVAEHVYMVRGLAYQKGPITLRFPLPASPFIEGLPKDRFLLVREELPPPAQTSQPVSEEFDSRDPLQATPSTWSSPELNAKQGSSKEDPLNARREKRVRHPQDPLKARTERDSENLLQLKEQGID